ncbi:MAG TPA: ShlB/FhaC/HecB family hemolysin secretion/activation protein, partial [Sedimentisphaerales bacterium]
QELRFGRLSYDVPVGTDGIRIGTTASYSEVWPDDARRLIDTRTVNQTYELRGSIAPIETRQTSLTLTAAFGFTDEFEKDTFGTTYNDHIRTVRLLANYRLQDQLDGSNYFSVGLRQGVSALGATQSGDPFSSRDGASPNFSVLDFSYIRYQKLSDAWSIKTSVSGQLGSGPLYSSQAFYLGGAAFGPGYYSGDDGIAGLAELRFDKSVESAFIKSYQLYGFVDGGQVWNRDEPKQSLSSIGVGVRLRLIDELHAGIAIAAPLTYTSRMDEFRQSRILFSLSNTFKFCPDRAQMRCF